MVMAATGCVFNTSSTLALSPYFTIAVANINPDGCTFAASSPLNSNSRTFDPDPSVPST